MLRIAATLIIAAVLSGCSGLTYYAHDKVPAPDGQQSRSITLDSGQTIKILKHRSGLMWEGYKEGVAVEDPSIAEVRDGTEGSDDWAPTVYLIGLKPGTIRAVYCNRLGDRPDFSQDLDGGFQRGSFEVVVRRVIPRVRSTVRNGRAPPVKVGGPRWRV